MKASTPTRDRSPGRKVYSVLVFPGGTEIGLEIQKALSKCKDIRLHSAGANVSNHAPLVFARHFVVPSVHAPGWLDRLNEVLVQNRIDYIFPAHDDVIVALAENADRVKAKVVTSPADTCRITRSKRETYRAFRGILPVPTVYESVDTVVRYPVFVKPDQGQGTQDTHVARSRTELVGILENREGHLVMEYLPGEEYTIDCFSDRERGLLFCGGRQRVRTKSGISMDSRPAEDSIFQEYAQTISKNLPLHGAWFFQVKRDAKGTYKLLEIAPRVAGTMALHRVLGVNFPLLSLYEQERIPLEILTNRVSVEIDRALTNRYKHNLAYRVVYVDLDDTLLLNGTVNVELVRFLYQCVNAGKRLVLLTKHAANVDATLKEHRLAGLFDEIIHFRPGASKADTIRERDAILIDDSFSERKDVAEKCHIPTFDGSMLEMLIDDRV